MHKILFLGPQGSGKGTQATRLSQKLGLPALSMGQLLRDEAASESDLGAKISSFINDGQLVPDDITTAVLKKRLEADDVQGGFIIDSFPRFLEQYQSSKSFFEPSAVIVLDIPREESLKRIMKRAETEDRADDTPENIEKRLQWSKEKTEPVIEKYKELGTAHIIDGVGDRQDVENRIDSALGI